MENYLYRKIANFLTGLRLIISVIIVFLGVIWKERALPCVSLLFLTGWTTDTLDGYFARKDFSDSKSWLSENDRTIDTLMILSAWIYLAVSGFISEWVALLYPVGASVIIYKFPSKAVLTTIETLPVLKIPLLTFYHNSLIGFIWILWATGALILDRKNLKMRLILLKEDFNNRKRNNIRNVFK